MGDKKVHRPCDQWQIFTMVCVCVGVCANIGLSTPPFIYWQPGIEGSVQNDLMGFFRATKYHHRAKCRFATVDCLEQKKRDLEIKQWLINYFV